VPGRVRSRVFWLGRGHARPRFLLDGVFIAETDGRGYGDRSSVDPFVLGSPREGNIARGLQHGLGVMTAAGGVDWLLGEWGGSGHRVPDSRLR